MAPGGFRALPLELYLRRSDSFPDEPFAVRQVVELGTTDCGGTGPCWWGAACAVPARPGAAAATGCRRRVRGQARSGGFTVTRFQAAQPRRPTARQLGLRRDVAWPPAGARRSRTRGGALTPGVPPIGPLWVILPTYNEAENLEMAVGAILEGLTAAAPTAHRVLIVDDASPDGTGALADGLAEAHPGLVEVLHRPAKHGLGRAYLAGFALALDAGAGLLVEMDADLSHDPADLPRLVAAAGDADLVLGSRYVPGGQVLGWGPLRKALSRGGSRYAQAILGLDVHDLTGGFKCFRREVLEAIDLPTVRSQGYGFQVELTYRVVRAGFRVREVPIVFRDRRAGKSKMSWWIALEAVWRVPQIRVRDGR